MTGTHQVGWTKARSESKHCSFPSLAFLFLFLLFNVHPLVSNLTHTSFWSKRLTWLPAAPSSAGKSSVWFSSGCSLAVLLISQGSFFYAERSLFTCSGSHSICSLQSYFTTMTSLNKDLPRKSSHWWFSISQTSVNSPPDWEILVNSGLTVKSSSYNSPRNKRKRIMYGCMKL